MVRRRQLWLSAAFLMISNAAWAHHSTAMYDYSKEKTIAGTVRQWQYTNPHCYLQLLVPDGKGGQTEWAIESGTVSGITARMGMNKNTFKPGDKVTVLISPARNNQPAGTLRSVKFADGRVLNTPTANFKGDAKGNPALGFELPEIKRATPEQPKAPAR